VNNAGKAFQPLESAPSNGYCRAVLIKILDEELATARSRTQ
jgi:hypothetical protein